MTSVRQHDDERRGALFWLGISVAVLFPLRVVVKALDAPMALRAGLGLVFITVLVALAGAFVARRLRGDVVPARAAVGVWGVALFLVSFALLMDGRSPLVTAVVGLGGIVAVGAALAASFWD
jgi:hypothetical protein